MPVIRIPGELGDKNLVPFFKGWLWDDDPDDPITFVVEKGTHLAPWAITLFGAYGIWLKEVRNKQVEIDYFPDSYSGRFIEKMGLPQLLGTAPKAQPDQLENRNIFPLTRIKDSRDIAPAVEKFLRMLEVDDEEMEGAIKYSLVELLRNVVQHSRSRIGGITSAVYFKNTGLVDIVVSDIGCGLKASLRESYPEINTYHKAVRFALNPHVSGTFRSGAYHSMRDNAGLGLFFIREIASRSGGGFFLGSGDVMADIWGNKDGTLGKKYVQATRGGWRGTFALLQLRKDSIGEFDSLLSTCRRIAAEVRKDRSEFIVDFVDEKMELEGLKTICIKEFEENVEEAAKIREKIILPTLDREELLVLDFSGVRAATQSFIHALMYRVFRDGKNLETCLTVSCVDKATEEAIKAVAAYAAVENG